MVYKYGFSDNQSLEGYYNNFAMSHFDVNDFQEQSIPDVIKPEFGVVTECRYTLTLFTLVWTELLMNFILSQSSNATLILIISLAERML